jgi:hypothetical protein
MKMNVEIECTPEEARRFMGLPDVQKANDAYVEALTSAMQGTSSIDQLQEFGKHLAPMGDFGMKVFQQFVESAMKQVSSMAPDSTSKSGK